MSQTNPTKVTIEFKARGSALKSKSFPSLEVTNATSVDEIISKVAKAANLSPSRIRLTFESSNKPLSSGKNIGHYDLSGSETLMVKDMGAFGVYCILLFVFLKSLC